MKKNIFFSDLQSMSYIYLKRVIFSFLFCVFLSIPVFPHSPEWITFVGMEGVYDLICVGEYVWIGTDGGLVKLHKKTGKKEYYNTTNTNLPGNRIWSFARDSLGNIWIGGIGGIGYYDGTNWKVFTSSNSNVPNMNACVIAVDKNNNVWVGSAGIAKLAKYDWSRWHEYKIFTFTTGGVLAIQPDWRGKTMVGTGAGSVAGLYEVVDTATGKQDSIIGRNEVSALAVDSNDNLLVSAYGLYCYTIDSLIIYDTANSNNAITSISDIEFSSKGELYCATYQGLLKSHNGIWHLYNMQNSGIHSNNIFKIDIDEEDNVWLGTHSQGVGRFDGSSWTNYALGNSPLMSGGIYFHALAIDNAGNCWIGQHKTNLVMFDGQKWHTYDTSHFSLLDSVFKRICTIKDKKVWADTCCAIEYTDSLGWYSYTIGRPGYGSIIKRDSHGIYWHMTTKGLYKYTDTGAVAYTTDNSNIPDNYCEKGAFDTSGVLWISIMPRGSDRKGMLVTFKNDNFTVQHTCRPTYWVTDIQFEPSNTMWYSVMTRESVGSNSGEGIYKKEGATTTNYTISNSGLPSNSVVDLCLDTSGTLWIGSYYGGLTTFDRDVTWEHYTTSNSSIPSNEVVQIEIDNNGNKWLNLYFNGLAIYRKGGVILNNSTHINSYFSKKHKSHYRTHLKIINNSLHFYLIKPSVITVTLYNFLGQKTGDIIKKNYNEGHHVIPFFNERNSLANGYYFLSFKAENYSKVIRFFYIKCL